MTVVLVAAGECDIVPLIMKDQGYLDIVRMEFQRLERMADDAVSQLDDEQLFTQVSNQDNSAAIVMKHMAGNMWSRWRDFLTTDGEKPDRDRDSEFVIADGEDRTTLNERWERGWTCLLEALAPLQESDLARTVTIRGEPHTVLQAINRQLTHYAYHTGQIVHIAKSLRGDRWQTLSIAKGQSQSFNQKPEAYLDESP